MAETIKKQYLDYVGLTKYDTKIKGVIASEAQVAKEGANAYTDGKVTEINGSIATVAEAAATLAGRVTTAENDIDAVEGRLDTLEAGAGVEGSVDNKIKTATDTINATIGAVTEGKTVVEMIDDAKKAATYDDTKVKEDIAANAKAISDEAARADAAEKANAKAISDEVARATAAEEALGTFIGEIPVDSTATTVVEYVDEQVAAEKSARESAVNNINTKIGDVAEGKTVVGLIDEAKQAAIDSATYDDTEVRGLITAEAARAAAAEKANADAIAAHKELVDDVVTTLVGDDSGKSVRTIANEELVAQLIPEAAKESLNTLEEIAAWIQAHPDDAAAMNKAITDEIARAQAAEKTNADAISALSTLVGTLPEGITEDNFAAWVQALDTAMDGRVDALEAAIGDGGSVADKINAAIGALDYTDTVEGDYVSSVSEVDGVISVTKGTFNFDTKGSAAQALQDAKDYADGLVGNISSISDTDIDALFVTTPAEEGTGETV